MTQEINLTSTMQSAKKYEITFSDGKRAHLVCFNNADPATEIAKWEDADYPAENISSIEEVEEFTEIPQQPE